MVDEKLIKFFEGVLSKTKEGKIPWEPTAQESNFIAAIGGQFSLSISSQADRYSTAARGIFEPLEKYALVLRDMHDRIATVADSDEGIRPGAMRELYETARYQAVHGGEKINKAIEVLQTL
ncbi:MAG: hypothetical protein ABSG65_30260 [Bryobacteraceae bacterium]|jgi:hypothetical protein